MTAVLKFPGPGEDPGPPARPASPARLGTGKTQVDTCLFALPVSRADREVALSLCQFCWYEDLACWPSLGALARANGGMPVRTLQVALRRLERAGAIARPTLKQFRAWLAAQGWAEGSQVPELGGKHLRTVTVLLWRLSRERAIGLRDRIAGDRRRRPRPAPRPAAGPPAAPVPAPLNAPDPAHLNAQDPAHSPPLNAQDPAHLNAQDPAHSGSPLLMESVEGESSPVPYRLVSAGALAGAGAREGGPGTDGRDEAAPPEGEPEGTLTGLVAELVGSILPDPSAAEDARRRERLIAELEASARDAPHPSIRGFFQRKLDRLRAGEPLAAVEPPRPDPVPTPAPAPPAPPPPPAAPAPPARPGRRVERDPRASLARALELAREPRSARRTEALIAHLARRWKDPLHAATRAHWAEGIDRLPQGVLEGCIKDADRPEIRQPARLFSRYLARELAALAPGS